MPCKSYLSLMKRKKPIYDDGNWKAYDFTSERGTYVYRNLKSKKYTPLAEDLVKKCRGRILRTLADEFTHRSEYFKCVKACKQPARRFLVAIVLLWRVEKKIEVLESDEKVYLELVNENRPITNQAISVVPLKLPKMLKPRKEEDVQNDYRLYREMHGR